MHRQKYICACVRLCVYRYLNNSAGYILSNQYILAIIKSTLIEYFSELMGCKLFLSINPLALYGF